MATTTSSARSFTAVVASGVVSLLFVSLGSLEGVDGLATKSTYYNDGACELVYSSSSLIFGFPDLDNSAVLQGFNECSTYSDGTVSLEYVCDATTGETGLNSFADGTCTRLDYEGAAAPSCVVVTPDAECDGSEVCSYVTECTDDVASAITPNVVNFVAIEYYDASCTEPTGNTEIVSSGSEEGEVNGECFEISPGTGYSTGECRADGSYIVQTFLPNDDKCSGDVWVQTTSPAELSPPLCSAVAVDGLYYGYVSCTTDAATVWMVAAAPATAPAPAPAPTPTTVDTDGAADTPAPAIAPTPTTVDTDGAADTPAPAIDVDDSAKAPAASTDTDDDTAADAPTPAPSVGDDVVDKTSAPSADVSRGISLTAFPTASPTVGVEETAAPTENDETAPSSGAAGVGSGVAAASIALSCAVGAALCVAM